MNSVFRLVWNTSNACWQAVAETARGRHKNTTKTGLKTSTLILLNIARFNIKPLALSLAIGLFGASVYAEPTGGQITAGAGTINQAGTVTTINQQTQNMAIDWHSFNVRANEAVNFNQPNANAIALNRVTGLESSSILGSLTANGKVFILNPNGILFGAGAQVNVGGLVASTLNLSNANFMAGNFNFTGNGTGSVVNNGNINITEGGTLAFIAPVVKNNGTIVANNGNVLLAAADDVTLTLQDGNMVSYTLNKGSVQSMINSGGLIQANGGHVIITAKGQDALSKSAINHTGIIEAQSVSNKNGVIELLGDMEIGTLNVSGTLDASAPIIGDGGFVETSAAKVNIADDVIVTTIAENGNTGTWLIDPVDLTVAASGGDMTGQAVSNALLDNNFIIDSDNGSSGTGGNVYINDEISWSANLFRIDADDSIFIRNNLNGSGTATLAFNYGQGTSTGEGSNYYLNGGKVNLPEGNRFFTKQGVNGASTTHHVIISLGSQFQSGFFTLQGVKDNLFRNYVLGADIDASATSTWNAGFGFDPIGDLARAFTGTFDGFGHTISGLNVNRPNENALGLFGSCTGCEIKNVGVVNANINGGDRVGGLLGNLNSGSFSGNYVTGSIRGNNSIGGLVGSASNGSISNNYSTASVSGNIWVGGLIGITGPSLSITNNFSAGAVTGNGAVGGFLGSGSVTASNNYWDTETSGQTTSATGAGKTTADLQQQATYNGWDFDSVWGIAEGKSLPFLRSFNIVYIDNINYIPVYNLNQLQKINEQLNANYALLNDIDASATVNWNSGAGFVPIGSTRDAFSGAFNGLGHVVKNLSIQNQDIDINGVNAIGLFGRAEGATISNVGLENVEIFDSYTLSRVGGLAGQIIGGVINNSYVTGNVSGTGKSTIGNSLPNATVGGLVGESYATKIKNSYSTASVTGGYAGGLVGISNDNIIEGSYAAGNVTGWDDVGGLVANLTFGSISNSYATGNVSGRDRIGGLVGNTIDATIQNSYATGNVSGRDYIGGLVGYDYPGTPVVSYQSTFNNGFWDFQSAGITSSAGGSGKTTAEMQQQATYTGWDFNNVWRIQEGSSNPLLRALTQGTIIIDPTNPLSITAPNVSKVYDGIAVNTVADLSVLTGWNGGASASGLLGADTLSDSNIFSGTLRYDGTWQGALNAGDYTIIPAGLSSQKYAIDYINGNLKINPKEIEVGTLGIGADNKTKIYGEADPAFTWQLNQGQLIGTDTITGSLTRELGEDVRIGGYSITQGSLTAGSNYTINFTNGVLTINPRPIVVWGSDHKLTEGDPLPTYSYTVYDKLSGNLKQGFSFVNSITFSNSAENSYKNLGWGAYPIEITNISVSPNYEVSQKYNGTLLVEPDDTSVIANTIFNIRDKLNGNLPTYSQVKDVGSPWQQLDTSKTVFHQNNIGLPEEKFIHPDGREVVYDGDSKQVLTDKFGGTYNFSDPLTQPILHGLNDVIYGADTYSTAVNAVQFMTGFEINKNNNVCSNSFSCSLSVFKAGAGYTVKIKGALGGEVNPDLLALDSGFNLLGKGQAVLDFMEDVAAGNLNSGNYTDLVVGALDIPVVSLLKEPAELGALLYEMQGYGSVSDLLVQDLNNAQSSVGEFIRDMNDITTQLEQDRITISEAKIKYLNIQNGYLDRLGELSRSFDDPVLMTSLALTGNLADTKRVIKALDNSINRIAEINFQHILDLAALKVIAQSQTPTLISNMLIQK